MPAIRRLTEGYKGVVVLHSSGQDEEKKIRYCPRCQELFGVEARLGPKIMPLDEATGKPIPKPHDYDHWLECRNCGGLYPKHETKVEPVLESVVKANVSKGKNEGVEKRKKGKGIGVSVRNPRLRKTRDEIDDDDLKRDLKGGAVLLSYSSNDPL